MFTFYLKLFLFCTRDIDNNTPLHLASAAGQLSCITYLLSVHPDLIDCCNDAGVCKNICTKKTSVGASKGFAAVEYLLVQVWGYLDLHPSMMYKT